MLIFTLWRVKKSNVFWTSASPKNGWMEYLKGVFCWIVPFYFYPFSFHQSSTSFSTYRRRWLISGCCSNFKFTPKPAFLHFFVVLCSSEKGAQRGWNGNELNIFKKDEPRLGNMAQQWWGIGNELNIFKKYGPRFMTSRAAANLGVDAHNLVKNVNGGIG